MDEMAVISKAQIEDSAVAGLAQSTQLGATGAVKEPHAELKHFDVMMMDIGMPGIDGFAACRRIVELVHLVASNKYDFGRA